MFKKLFSIYYDDKLISAMLKTNYTGILAANVLVPLLSVSVLYSYVPLSQLLFWLFLHIILIFFRLYLSKKLSFAISKNSYDKQKYLNLYISTITATSILLGIISWYSIFYEIPDLNIFIIGILIVAVTSASIATQGTVFLSFVSFMFFSNSLFIISLIIYGGVIFNTFALIIFIYMVLHIFSGHRLFLIHQHSVELKSRFKTIFDKSSDGIVIIDNNRMVDCNETAMKMFGYDTRESFFQTPLHKLMPEQQPDSQNSMKKMLSILKKAKKHTITFEWFHSKKNSDYFWVEITLTPMTINRKNIIHGVWRDISHRKAIEEKLKILNLTLEERVKDEVVKNREKEQQIIQQSRLAQMGEMISMIAHQWRQPLAAISSSSASLQIKAQLGTADKETVIKKAQNIARYSQHLSSTIDDFRDFFKPTKEKSEVTYTKIVESVLDIVQISIINKNIAIFKEFNTQEVFETNENELKQVVLNLIKNSEDILLEKNVSNPFIKLTTYSNKNSHILEISDNGGGIPKEIIDKIFDPYFSTKSKKNGTGLGLYMSKLIIEEHCQGKLTVSNIDNGALFKITLNSKGE
jgi:PAS domain S-box-containing protein